MLRQEEKENSEWEECKGVLPVLFCAVSVAGNREKLHHENVIKYY